MARQRRSETVIVNPVVCPICFGVFATVTGHHDGLAPVSARLVYVARLVANPSAKGSTAQDVAIALGISRNAAGMQLRRAEAAGLIRHTNEQRPHIGGRRFVYRPTILLAAYAPDVPASWVMER